MNDPIEERMAELRETADKCAEAYGLRVRLEEGKKSVLATLMKEYEKKGFKTTAAQEREALADERYAEMLDGLQVAIVEHEKLRQSLRLTEMKVDVWRTLQASKRAEMRGYGA